MKALIQRVARAAVRVDGDVVGAIGRGLLLFVGVEGGDDEADAARLARKVAALRCFPGRTPMDRSLEDVGGACLVVSQFTLCASLAKGNRPGFGAAEDPARAEALYRAVAEDLAQRGIEVATGRFGAMMEVELVNDGPVTFWLEIDGGSVR